MRCVCVGRRRFDGCLRWWLVLSVGLCAYGCLRRGLGVRASTGLSHFELVEHPRVDVERDWACVEWARA